MRATPYLCSVAVFVAATGASAQPAQRSVDLGGVPLELTLIPAGSFRQGSPVDEAGRRDDEGPRDVTLTRAFYLGVVPVTRGQFARFVAETSYRTESETGRSGGFGLEGTALVQRPGFHWRNPGFPQDDTHPVALVTYVDAERFLAWAAQRSGLPLRLPTEAEWERACRAGSATAWYAGDTPEHGRAAGWFNDATPAGTRPVRGRLPNAYGLFDMVGNVQQWVADWYGPLDSAPATDPQVTTPDPALTPPRRVLRGGSWLRPVQKGRCAARERATPGSRNADTGFRVALDAAAALAPPPPPPPPPPPAPLVDPPRPPDPPRESSSNTGLLAGLAALGAAFVAVLFARGRGGRRVASQEKHTAPLGGAVGGPDVRLVAGKEGFRVFAPAHRAGQRVRVEYRHGGKPMTKWVVIDPTPKGQFVYTGGQPQGLVLISVVEAVHDATSHDAGHGHVGAHDAGHGLFGTHDAGHGHTGGHTDPHDEPVATPLYQGPPSAY